MDDLKKCERPDKILFKDKWVCRWVANMNQLYVYPCSDHFHMASIKNSKNRASAKKWHDKLFGDHKDIDGYNQRRMVDDDK